MTISIKDVLRLLICTMSGILCAFNGAMAQQSIVDLFQERSQTLEGVTLPYRLFVPQDYDDTQAYPLVLALHGAGERGSDNERHIRPHRLATAWADPVNQAEYPAFVVAPQVPSGGRWTADAPVDESAFNAFQLTTLNILDSLEVEFNIDLDRVYVTGLSMGGHGTWDFISRLPDRFAAAVPMSGNADPAQASAVLHIPIWAFHGESDTVVPASGSRGILYNMENLGREVVYTDCLRSLPLSTNFDCPGTMPNSELTERINDHADLIFTSTRGGGHGPWSVWYDHPLLMDWLYAQHRIDPNALQITAPEVGSTNSDILNVAWAFSGSSSDSVEVWLSVDNGGSWELVATVVNGEGTYALDSNEAVDSPVARVRLIVRDQDGYVYGRTESEPFTINNDGDASPFLSIDDEDIRFNSPIEQRELSLRFLAADPEGSELQAQILYSADGGNTYAQVKEMLLPFSLESRSITLDLEGVPNSSNAMIRVAISDGIQQTEAETAPFVKQTPRVVNDYVVRVEGEGVGDIFLHFIDPGALTGHRYRLTIDSTDPSAKTYSVLDLETMREVLSAIPLSDGVLESPVFDGMRLVVQDLEEGMADLEKTGWLTGTSDVGISISGGNTVLALQTVPLLETEKAYELVFASSVVDTSLAAFALPAQAMQFYVREAGDTEQLPVLYRDIVRDGRPSSQDVLYILEQIGEDLLPAWEFRFSSTSQTAFPESGDVFQFVPLKKLSSEDVFEFIAAVGVHVTEDAPLRKGGIAASYPNPFKNALTVEYHLDIPGHVEMELFDVLGRLVGRLKDEHVGAGTHTVSWIDNTGRPLASGLYVVRMTTRYIDGVTHREHRSVMRLH